MDLLDVPLVNISIKITWQACFILSCLLITQKYHTKVIGWINTMTNRRRGNRRGKVDTNAEGQKRGSIATDDFEASSTRCSRRSKIQKFSLMSTTEKLEMYRRQIRMSFLSKRRNMDILSDSSLMNQAFLDATQHLDEAFNQEPSPFFF